MLVNASSVLFYPLAQAFTTYLFVCFPLAGLHAEHVFQQGKFSLREIFFGPVAQFACVSFLHNTEGLCDLFRAFKSLQLSEGFEERYRRLAKCFHRFFFSDGIQPLALITWMCSQSLQNSLSMWSAPIAAIKKPQGGHSLSHGCAIRE